MLESELTPGNEDSPAPPNPDEDSGTSRQAKIDEVVKLLAGDDGKPDTDDKLGDDGKPTAQGEDPPKAGTFETLDDIAKALDVEVSALYDIAIKQQPGPDGEDQTVKLGELADMAKDRGQFELDRVEFEERKTKREGELMVAQQQLNEIVGMLPKSAISTDLVNAVAKKVTETQKAERSLTMTAIPEWQDERTETSERAQIQETLSAYGFSSNYLDTVHDHRTLKYIRDNWQREQRMTRALAAMRKLPPKNQRPSKPAGAPKKQQPGKRASSGPQARDAKVAAVADLLRANEG